MAIHAMQIHHLPPWSSYQYLGRLGADMQDTQQGEKNTEDTLRLLLQLQHGIIKKVENGQHLKKPEHQQLPTAPRYIVFPTRGINPGLAYSLAVYGTPWKGGNRQTRGGKEGERRDKSGRYQGVTWFGEEGNGKVDN